MKGKRFVQMWAVLALLISLGIGVGGATSAMDESGLEAPASTSFTYQGQLRDGSGPVNATCDLQFKLWDASGGGAQVGGTVLLEDVVLVDGLFTARLDFGAAAFRGQARYLEVLASCPVGSAFVPLPRQELTGSPYALWALGAPWTGLEGVPADLLDGDQDTTYTPGAGLVLEGTEFRVNRGEVQWRVSQTCAAGSSIRAIDVDGTVTCEVDDNTTYTPGTGLSLVGGQFSVNFAGTGSAGTASRSDHNHAGTYWQLGGNAGTVPGTNYLGTSDNAALVLKVNNTRALRIEPSGEAPNLIGGWWENYVTAGVRGATIGGGGGGEFGENRVTDDFGTVSGGIFNQAGDGIGTTSDRGSATVGGGYENTANGEGSTVSGGAINRASGYGATVGGGVFNAADGYLATVGGGGSSFDDAGNRATDNWTTVSGGTNNQAGDGGEGSSATVGGGDGNLASGAVSTVSGGSNNVAGEDYATVGGGGYNTASGHANTISGGYGNTASNMYATVSGGQENTASGRDATVGGGDSNTASGNYATVGGGEGNTGASSWATIGGGSANEITGGYANTVGGGWANQIGGAYATIAGGSYNIASGENATIGGGGAANALFSNHATGDYATIGGGVSNFATAAFATISGGGCTVSTDPDSGNLVSDDFGTVGGGGNNRAGDDAGTTEDRPFATVGGGRDNLASGTSSVVAGGDTNTASGYRATMGGGYSNMAGDDSTTVSGGSSNTANADYATVGGGYNNLAIGANSTVGGGTGNSALVADSTVGGGNGNVVQTSGSGGTIGGGWHNFVNGNTATVPGGAENEATGGYSFAAGAQAHATHAGSFVWSSGTATDSWGANTFTARSHGGARFYTAAGTGTGVQLGAGGTSWGSISDRNAKEAFAPVDTARLLEVLARMPVQTWNLKAQASELRHIGPVAQDFNGSFTYLFGEVESPIYINNMDAVGVSLAASQGLYDRVQALEAENAVLQDQLDDLGARLAALEGKPSAGGSSARLPVGWLLLGGGVLVGGVVVGRRARGGLR